MGLKRRSYSKRRGGECIHILSSHVFYNMQINLLDQRVVGFGILMMNKNSLALCIENGPTIRCSGCAASGAQLKEGVEQQLSS